MTAQNMPNPHVPGGEYRYATNKSVPQAHVNMQTSEAHVFQAAAQIYSAYILATQGTANEQQLVERSVEAAIRLAQRVDARILSAEETSDQGKPAL